MSIFSASQNVSKTKEDYTMNKWRTKEIALDRFWNLHENMENDTDLFIQACRKGLENEMEIQELHERLKLQMTKLKKECKILDE